MKKAGFFLFCGLVFFACGETDSLDLDFRVGAAINHLGQTNGHELSVIVSSRADLIRAAETRYYQVLTGDDGQYNVYYLSDATEKYDDEYFAQNALVLYLYNSGAAGGSIEIKQILRQDSELSVITDYHQGPFDALSSWTVVLELTQAAVFGVTGLKIINECLCPGFLYETYHANPLRLYVN